MATAPPRQDIVEGRSRSDMLQREGGTSREVFSDSTGIKSRGLRLDREKEQGERGSMRVADGELSDRERRVSDTEGSLPVMSRARLGEGVDRQRLELLKRMEQVEEFFYVVAKVERDKRRLQDASYG